MSTNQLYRFSGLGLLIGGLLALIGALIQVVNGNPLGPAWVPSTVLIVIGELLLIAGLPGMYARQAEKAGVVGLIGFLLFFFSVLMQGGGGGVTNLFFLPWLLQNAPHQAPAGPPTIGIFFILAGLLSVVGAILLGIATIRAGVEWTLAYDDTNLVGGFCSPDLEPLHRLSSPLFYFSPNNLYQSMFYRSAHP